MDRTRRVKETWVNVVARDPKTGTEWTVWSGFTKAPEVMVIISHEPDRGGD